jgi:hypothetical protein
MIMPLKRLPRWDDSLVRVWVVERVAMHPWGVRNYLLNSKVIDTCNLLMYAGSQTAPQPYCASYIHNQPLFNVTQQFVSLMSAENVI